MIIKIKAQKDGKVKSFPVEVADDMIFGPLAVNEDLFFGGWRITHIKTGWAVTNRLAYRRGAIALAKRLAKRKHLFENLSTKDKSRNAEAAAWFGECLRRTKSAQHFFI